MAHSLSSKKRIRQNEKTRARNRARRSALRGKLKGLADSLLHSNAEKAESQFPQAVRALDREAARRTLHPNAAARKKSRLARKMNMLRQKPKT